MARKRNSRTSEEEKSVKRPCADSPKPERNLLNDGILNLYKKELDFRKEKSSSSQDESNTENKSKENGTSKTPSKSGRRGKMAAIFPKNSSVDFGNIGGMDDVINEILFMLMHYKLPDTFKENKISPATGILLHGPPGSGKTYLAHAIAGEVEVPIIQVSATELVSGISGESEGMIREIFAAALATGRCILFIDEIDAICRKRETNENAMLGRMVTQMIKSFDELSEKDPDGNIVVIGATNMLDSLDNALRRSSRFTHEIGIGMPNEEGRLNILEVICKDLSLDFDFRWLAHHTPGYVGADLKALVTIAQKNALYRGVLPLPPDETGKNVELQKFVRKRPKSEARKWYKALKHPDKVIVTLEDFKVALQKYVPTAKREGFVSVPETTWDEIGSYEDVKKILEKTIMWPVQDYEFYEENNLFSNNGVLLYGPKGCGKTLLAKALANECSMNFIAVQGPELLNMYVGESEKAVRRCFERARNSAPCIIFFDEFDALCPPRSSYKENAATERVVNQLLTETSGILKREQVFLMAATNRLDKIDSAVLRPGRFDKKIYVGLPTPAGRVEILKSHLKAKILEEGFEFEKIAFDTQCDHFSGADISNLVNEAVSIAIEEVKSVSPKPKGKLVLCMRHFDKALTIVEPSISEEERIYFESISAKPSNRL